MTQCNVNVWPIWTNEYLANILHKWDNILKIIQESSKPLFSEVGMLCSLLPFQGDCIRLCHNWCRKNDSWCSVHLHTCQKHFESWFLCVRLMNKIENNWTNWSAMVGKCCSGMNQHYRSLWYDACYQVPDLVHDIHDEVASVFFMIFSFVSLYLLWLSSMFWWVSLFAIHVYDVDNLLSVQRHVWTSLEAGAKDN